MVDDVEVERSGDDDEVFHHEQNRVHVTELAQRREPQKEEREIDERNGDETAVVRRINKFVFN